MPLADALGSSEPMLIVHDCMDELAAFKDAPRAISSTCRPARSPAVARPIAATASPPRTSPRSSSRSRPPVYPGQRAGDRRLGHREAPPGARLNPTATYEQPTREGGAWTQVSRIGQPLINEVIVGLGDKDRFNGSPPSGDAQFLTYVTHPTVPVIVNILFGGMGAMRLDPHSTVSGEFPRTDLVAIYLTGIMGVKQPANVTPSEMMRLNTSIAPVAINAQNPLGVLGGDTAGYPNGRRPLDDVTDITLRAAMGAAIGVANAGTRTVPLLDYTDCARGRVADYLGEFPYFNTPFPGAARAP